MLRVLFVANGHGETAIAARIACELRAAANGPLGLDLLPLVGAGAGAFPLTLVGPRQVMPSGGLVAMGNVRAFWSDLRAGFAGLFARQLAFLAGARGRYDAVVTVGDVYALLLGLRAGGPAVFVGTAKSVYVAPYGPFERTVLKRAARVFVRDEPTAERLRRQGVAAQAPGNVIVDLVTPRPAVLGTWLGLLPGSRASAYADGVRLARVARELAAVRADVGSLLSVAPTLEAPRYARALERDGWSVNGDDDGFRADHGPAAIRSWQGDLGGLLGSAVVVLGQAGTANEQAAAFGLPIVALEDQAAGRNEWYRMRQRRLLGEALLLVPAEPRRAAAAIAALLADPAQMRAMGDAGRKRMGPPGGAAAIARAILAVAA